MAKICDQPLKQYPFKTHRDPKTGKWLVEKPVSRRNTSQ